MSSVFIPFIYTSFTCHNLFLNRYDFLNHIEIHLSDTYCESLNIWIVLNVTLNVSLSAIEISTCGVRKCIGGVPFSLERNES